MATMNLDLCLGFGELLSYPVEQHKPLAVDCYRQLQQQEPAAAAAFVEFSNFLEQQELPRIEEVYTATFDLQALCHPYVGFQLCGESQARTMFLMKLQELYAEHDFSAGTELPDHLSVLLRFIGSSADPAGNRDIIIDALLPTLEKLLKSIEARDQPYRQLLRALQIYLTTTVETELPEQQRQKELSHG
ncbi:MAG: nitrate reductase molybdenum cofactor assembly chaperone [Deltaproteobacteria bacterium]|nr:nitrate reductase molybdenum cofactor assembly chaperone [Deltaproteobacteria bacterium]